MPETPPRSKGLLPSLSTTNTATPVISNYNHKRMCNILSVKESSTAISSKRG